MRAASLQSSTRVDRSERIPILVLTAVFGLSRLIFFTAGVRFDADTLTWYLQYIDPVLLRTDLLRSLYYLHIQPPLFNLYLGTVLKLFPESYRVAFAATYVLLGWALTLCLYALLRRLGAARWLSATAVAVFIVSAPCVLYENWLFYSYPVTVALCASAYFLHRFIDRGRLGDGFVFFALLGVLVLTRSVFHLFWYAFFVLVLVCHRSAASRRIIAAAILPFVLILSLYVKNYCVFGRFTTSTWLGPSLAKISTWMLPDAERVALARSHQLSGAALINPFLYSPGQFHPLVPPVPETGIPVLDQVKRSTGPVNANNLTFVAASDLYRDDALYVIRSFPRTYLKGVSWAYIVFFEPASASALLAKNIRAIERWTHLCALFLYGSGMPTVPSVPEPVEAAYMGVFLIAAYAIALAYGIGQVWRLLCRPDSRTARTVTLAYLCLNVLYVMVVCNALEVGENNRFRFPTEPLVVALLAACITDAVRRWKGRRHPAAAGPPRA